MRKLHAGGHSFFCTRTAQEKAGWRQVAVFACVLFGPSLGARAIEVRISAPALERTLKTQLFTVPAAIGEPGRYYLRGNLTSPCSVYADDPHVSFREDRIVVHLRTHSKLGTALHGTCVGIALNTDAEVSFVPEAEAESIGFRDARIEHLSENKELNFLLAPFLSHKLPGRMKMNAAELMRTLLVHAPDSTGYTLTLSSLKLHSMMVEGQELVVDVDAKVKVD